MRVHLDIKSRLQPAANTPPPLSPLLLTAVSDEATEELVQRHIGEFTSNPRSHPFHTIPTTNYLHMQASLLV